MASTATNRYLAAVGVLVASLGWFSLRVERSGIATAYCDPVSNISAQDEGVYGREAIEMVTDGHWLTPTYLGRYMLNKPPLLQWLVGVSIKCFGVSAWSLRLPSLAAAALITTLVFLLVWQIHRPTAAAGAVLLLVSNHLFYVFSRLAMTDMLLTLWLMAAMYVLVRDPALSRTSSFLSFGVCSGAAIMTKGAAGLLPLIALALHAALAPRDLRPRPARLAAVAAGAAIVALPWHLYQLAAHPRWFLAEYILTQHLAVGVTAPPQYSNENHLIFYTRRLFLTDPVLSIVSALSLAPLLLKVRQRSALLVWPAVVVAALFAFRFRSGSYVLPLIPMLAVLAAELPVMLSRRGRVLALSAFMACTVVKVSSSSPVWAVPAGVASQRSGAAGLEPYCEQHRNNVLILIEPSDAFYSSDLPLPQVHYCWRMPEQPSGAQAPPLDFAWLGISTTVSQYNQLETWLPIFRSRLEYFGLPSDAAVATAISSHSLADVKLLIEAHPEADFSLPEGLQRDLGANSPHRIVPAGSGRVFLLAPASGVYLATRPCHL
jgi:Dolichyl-phosphate-mannose-protein mannosyltransferase